MVDAGSFKNGITIQYENGIWQVIEFQHVKPGKGSPFVRAKLKNIISGGVIENSFRPTEKFDLAHIDRSEYQYLYADGDLYNFMNTESTVSVTAFPSAPITGFCVAGSIRHEPSHLAHNSLFK